MYIVFILVNNIALWQMKQAIYKQRMVPSAGKQ
jgi:hypothetical protein